jgi:hypothetical protein
MPSTVTSILDGLSTSVAVKAPCRVATTVNITLSGLQTVDSVAVVADDRVLVKDQSTASENGIYVASSGNWTRAKDFDGNRDVRKGTLVVVESSGVNIYYRVTASNPIVIGTSSITFEAVSGTLTQAAVGAVLYPLSGAEGSASITPTDFSDQYGNIERTGAANASNSSTAIQAMINQNEVATGAAVIVPHGRYVLNAMLDSDGVLSIYGTGYYSELELPSAATHRALLVQDDSFAAINGVRLRDFRVDGNTGGAFESGLVQLNNAVGFVVDGLWVENGSRASGASGCNGVAFSAGTNGGTGPRGTVLNSYFEGMSKGAINISTECDGITAAFNISKSNTGNGTTPGIQVFGAFRSKIIGNIAQGNQGRGIFAAADTLPNPTSYTLIALNHSYGNGTGTGEGDGIAVTNPNASVSHARSIVESNFVIDNGDGLVSGGSGITVVATKSVDVRGNWVYDNALHGIFLSAQGAIASGHIRVVDNVIENNNVKDNASGAGVFVAGTFDTLEISRNKIYNSDAALRHRYGIYIDDAAVINDLTILDNDITGMVSANHYFGAGGAAITRFFIRVRGQHQTDDANQDTVFAFPLPDNSACYLKITAVGIKDDGTKRAAYERRALIYRDGAGATIESGSQTSLFSQETDADYDASISVTGNLMVILIRGDTGDTVNWRWTAEAQSI